MAKAIFKKSIKHRLRFLWKLNEPSNWRHDENARFKRDIFEHIEQTNFLQNLRFNSIIHSSLTSRLSDITECSVHDTCIISNSQPDRTPLIRLLQTDTSKYFRAYFCGRYQFSWTFAKRSFETRPESFPANIGVQLTSASSRIRWWWLRADCRTSTRSYNRSAPYTVLQCLTLLRYHSIAWKFRAATRINLLN